MSASSKSVQGRGSGERAAISLRESLGHLWGLLTVSERRRFGWVLTGMLLVALVQTAGVGSIAPFMALLSDPGLVQEDEVASWVFTTLDFESHYTFTFFVGIGVFAFIIVGNGLSAAIMWMMLRFVWGVNHRISLDLLKRYVNQPYTYFITRNTADLSTNILSEVGSVTSGMLIPGMKGLARAVVALGILGLLLAVDYKLALLSGIVLGGMYGAVYGGVQARLSSIGEKRRVANKRRFRAAKEALEGIKDVKVLGREQGFLDRYSAHSLRFARHSATSQIIASMPRYALETITFGGMVAILLYLLATRAGFQEVVPVISLYAFAGYRLMPALQHVFNGLTRARFYGAPLADLYRDMTTTVPDPPAAVSMDAGQFPLRRTVELEGVWFRYPGSCESVIRNVSLRIRRRQTVAFVGATGCGKTTLVDILMGLLSPHDGRVLVDGKPINRENVRSWQRQLGYVPQHIYLSDDTLARNIAFGVPEEEIELSRVEQAARIANVHDFIQSLPDGYETVAGDRGVRLSGGQRQRIGIARALYEDPEILILDEATSALDGVTEDAVMEAIHNLTNRKTIILIAHRLTTVQDAEIYFMREGEVVDRGSHADLIERSEEFRAMAGVEA